MKQAYLLLLLLNSTLLFSQPGSLDPSFGTFGVALSPFISQLSYAHAIAMQADGKILVAGHRDLNGDFRIFVTRYRTDGTSDASFTNFFTSIGLTGDYARAIAVQSDGKIVVAGHVTGTQSDFLVIRLTTTGAYDTTFGSGGIVITNFQGFNNDETNDMVIQPDGKILIAGWTSANNNKDVALLRFNTDGSVDSTFGVNGRVSTDLGNTMQEGHDVALQPDGKILVAGFSSSSTSANDVAVFRYHSNGMPDSSFGTSGVAMPVIHPDDDAAFAMTLQPDGKIVVAGYIYTSFTYADNLIVRFDSTGDLDTSFNSTGVVVSNSTNNDNIASGVIYQPDGKIVITGRSFHQSTFDLLLSRFNGNGSIDPSFGNGGHVYTPIGIEDDFSLASLIQPDGKIVLAGYYTDSGIENFFVARYLNDSTINSVTENERTEIFLYPQPATGLLHVQLSDKIRGDVIAEIYSVTSGLVKTVPAAERFSIKTDGMAKGIYFLRIRDGENRRLIGRRFVVD